MALYEYDAWGRTQVEVEDSSLTNEFRFSTKQLNSDSGLVYFGVRWLDPEVGRWTQRDPLGLVDGTNVYAYVGNDPVNLLDPWGLWEWDDDWLELGVGGLLGLQGRDVAVAGWSQIDEAAAAATADGIIPFWDPFEDYYADECGNVDDIYETSRGLGAFGRDLLGIAAGMSIASRAGSGAKAVQVSRWGRPGLKPGDWVMRGPPNVKNYLLSGKYQPSWMPGGNIPASFSSGQTFTVPGSALKTPPGFWGPLKGAIGQGIFMP